MLTTLDGRPQEWMEGDEKVIHTVSACHFENIEHAEHWINLLVPKDSNHKPVKWASRKKDKTRRAFIDNCLEHQADMDFKINCISTTEGNMSWFAWAYYFENQPRISQRIDERERNCFVFPDLNGGVSFPVLRAGYLIWYHYVIRYLAEFENIDGKFLSDLFCNDEKGKALGVSFVNYLLTLSIQKPQISLPTNVRFSSLDAISDNMCGWVNSVRTKTAPRDYEVSLREFEDCDSGLINNIEYAMNLNIVDEHGNDVTNQVKLAVANDLAEQKK